MKKGKISARRRSARPPRQAKPVVINNEGDKGITK